MKTGKYRSFLLFFLFNAGLFGRQDELERLLNLIRENEKALVTAQGIFEQRMHLEPHHRRTCAKFYYKRTAGIRMEYKKPKMMQGGILIQQKDIVYRYNTAKKKWEFSKDPGPMLSFDTSQGLLDENWEKMTALRVEKIKNNNCALIRVVRGKKPGSKEENKYPETATYQYWVDVETGLIMKSSAFNAEFKKMAESVFSYKKTNGVWFPEKMESEILTENGRILSMEYLYKKVKINESIKDDFFVCPVKSKKGGDRE
ncbi:MAG: hypothetical protein ABIJ15_01850 [bacterium]